MELLTVEETAKLLKINPMTVRRYITAGKLPAVKVGRRVRVRKEAVEGLLAPIAPKRPDADTIIREEGGGMKEMEPFVARPLTTEERARGLAVVETLKRLHDQMLAERNGVPFSPAWNLINEARDERGRDSS